MSRQRPAIVSFSGIDGAGKSTQIAVLESCLRDAGLRVTLLEFWHNVVVMARFREFMSHKAFRGDQGIGTPEKPLHRRDKNVTSWPATVVRFLFYLGDSLSLYFAVRKLRTTETDVVIFDRYIYDELANLPLNSWLARSFVRLLLKVAPKPDTGFLIDADPVAARARKPEYPLEFLHRNRDSYIALSRMIGDMIVIEPQSIASGEAKVRTALSGKLSLIKTAPTALSLVR